MYLSSNWANFKNKWSEVKEELITKRNNWEGKKKAKNERKKKHRNLTWQCLWQWPAFLASFGYPWVSFSCLTFNSTAYTDQSSLIFSLVSWHYISCKLKWLDFLSSLILSVFVCILLTSSVLPELIIINQSKPSNNFFL